MLENLLDPVILFFIMGVVAGLLRSDLRLPAVLYETLSIYLLVAIGLKGGVQLAESEIARVALPAVGTLLLGLVIPLIAYFILRGMGRFSISDAAAIAAHYGSVSAVTYAIVLTYVERLAIPIEGFTTVLLVLLEIPAILVGIFIARLKLSDGSLKWGSLLHEVFLGKSVYLLVGGLVIGYLAGAEKAAALDAVFTEPFKGALAFFLLEMGIVTSHRLADLKKVGMFLVIFAIGMPVISGALGSVTGWLVGLTPGGTAVLATLAASASYIAAPAAMRIAVPESNPTLYLVASLGVTFPFNITLGIPLYYHMALFIHGI
jgi:uncharacterized protein